MWKKEVPKYCVGSKKKRVHKGKLGHQNYTKLEIVVKPLTFFIFRFFKLGHVMFGLKTLHQFFLSK
jgi:hypothetical protein